MNEMINENVQAVVEDGITTGFGSKNLVIYGAGVLTGVVVNKLVVPQVKKIGKKIFKKNKPEGGVVEATAEVIEDPEI